MIHVSTLMEPLRG